MSPGTRPRGTLRHALWIGGLLVVLGGLFGMHGLDAHGVNTMGSTMHPAVTSPAPQVPAPHATSTASSVVTATVVATASRAAGNTGMGMGMGTAGMCLGLLVLTLMALISWLHSVRSAPLLWLAVRSGPAPRRRSRDPGPPSLIRLSIQRC